MPWFFWLGLGFITGMFVTLGAVAFCMTAGEADKRAGLK